MNRTRRENRDGRVGKLLPLLCGLACVCLIVSAANAGPMGPPATLPALGLRINDHGGGPPEEIDPPGVQIAESKFRYQGGVERGRWDVHWDIEADPDPFVHTTWTITNNLAVAQDFTVTVTLPIAPALLAPTLTGGSFSGTLLDTDGDGAKLEALAAVPMYMAIMDSVDYQGLMYAPQTITADPFGTTGFGPAQFGTPIPNQPGPAVSTDIAIELNVTLSPYDTASLVATFVVIGEVVPEPASMALLGFGALGLIRRRRR